MSNQLQSATPEELENMVQALQAEISNTTNSEQNFQIDLDELLSTAHTTDPLTPNTPLLKPTTSKPSPSPSQTLPTPSSTLIRTQQQQQQLSQRRATAPAISTPTTQLRNRQQLQNIPVASHAPPQGNKILDAILTTLPMEKQTAMRSLFTQLQQGNLTPETFLQQAHGLLGTRGAALLATSPTVPPSSPVTAGSPIGNPVHQGQHSTPYGSRNASSTRPPPGTPANYMSPTYDFIRKRREEEIASSSKKQRTDGSPGLPPRPMGPPPFPPGGYRPSPSAPSSMSMPRTGSFGSPMMYSRTPGPLGRPSTLSATGTPGATASDDKVDYDSLTDVMGYAGVDLKAESDAFLAQGDIYGGGSMTTMDRSTIQSFLNATALRKIMEGITKTHRITRIDPDVFSYLGLAAQERLRSLIEQMVDASKHRVTSQAQAPPPLREDGTPLYKITVTQDAKKQLLALERVEREEEQKRKEAGARRDQKETDDGEEGGEEEEGGGGKKSSKAKKSSAKPMSARNMPEDIRKRISNQTALLSAGIVQRSWMTSGSGKATGGSTPSPAPAVSTLGESQMKGGDKGKGATLEATSSSSSSTGGRRLLVGAHGAAKRITVRDALLTLEMDGGAGLGGGTVEKVLIRGFSKWMK